MTFRKVSFTLLMSLLLLVVLPMSTFAKEVNPYKKMQRGLRTGNLLTQMDKFESVCDAEYPTCPWDVEAMIDALSDATALVDDAKDALDDDPSDKSLQQDLKKAKMAFMALAKGQLPQFKTMLKSAEADWGKRPAQPVTQAQPQPQTQPQNQAQQTPVQSQQTAPQTQSQNPPQQQPVNTPQSTPAQSGAGQQPTVTQNVPLCTPDTPPLQLCKCPTDVLGTLTFVSSQEGRFNSIQIPEQNLLVGNTNVQLARFRISAAEFSCGTGREPLAISKIKFTDVMTGANANDGLRNIALYDASNKQISLVITQFQKVTDLESFGEFTLTPPLNLGETEDTWFTVRADVNGAAGSTHVIRINSLASDVEVIGLRSSKKIVPRGSAIGNIQTIVASGTLKASKGPGDEGTLRIGDNNAYLASFALSSNGEDVHVTSMTFTDMMTGQNAIDSIRNIRLYFSSTQLGENLPKLTAVNATTATGTFSFNLHIPNRALMAQMIIRADIVSGEGSTHQLKIASPETDIIAKGDTTKNPIKASGTAIFSVQTIGPKLKTIFDP